MLLTGIKHRGKEDNDPEEHRVGPVAEETVRLEYDASSEPLERLSPDTRIKEIIPTTGHDPNTV